MPSYRNLLSLDHQPKVVPYGGSAKLRTDGDANYGFKDVKGKLALLHTIPELARDAALLAVAKAISAPDTGLFSIGSVSGPVVDAKGFRHTGYIEFAFNSVSTAADASHYFLLYFRFDLALKQNNFSGRVIFQWELQPAQFTDAHAVGFTCSVFVNTFYSPTEQEAQANWEHALATLADYLGTVPLGPDDWLYGK